MNTPEQWIEDDDRLEKLFTFASFADAMGFMLRASYACEKLDHHPAWKNIYTRVWVSLTTHSAGNKVTAKDHALAKEMDALYQPYAK